MQKAKLKARQGFQHLFMDAVDVIDVTTMKSVQSDAKTLGEVMFRNNTVMNEYFKDAKATHKASRDGLFHTGDLGVRHPDGHIELKDRSNDIIISGGENISTTEVEWVILSHPDVLVAAVVGRPDDNWGDTPCAFVTLKDGGNASAEDNISFCCGHLPHYMTPKTFILMDDLPKASTAKIQKFVLRQKAKPMGSLPKRSISKL